MGVDDDDDDDVDNFFRHKWRRRFVTLESGRYPACASLTKTCKLVNLEAF